ncbi:murein biosynthesis integral membrane protein MurJ [Halothiobacillus sp. DCM-1]|uniref:murein biosynthesis integral membrane protein MurJ n=1 Tax=Halothiobacillus sp. DCM-1 TaxID=3112558 RepID=UPI00325565E2
MASLLRSSAVISSMTLLSRILGFVRDMLLARVFGASPATDAFFVVFKIPNFLRRLFAEGAFAQAFVPVLSEYREKSPREELKDYIDHMFGTLAAVVALVVALGISAAPLVILLFAPGFSGDPTQQALAEHMLWITFPYLFFISLTAFAASTLNAFGKFAMPALAPIWLNIALIGATLLLAPHLAEPVMALAWGVFLAGILQLVFLLPFLARLGLLPRPRFGRHSGVRKTIRLMLPAMFGASVTQINLLVDTILASLLVAGSVSWLYYSDRLVELPLGVFGVAISTVILPKLSRAFSRTDQGDFTGTLNWAIKFTLLLGLPMCAGLIVLATPMLSTLFEYGSFSALDTHMVALAMSAYALGLPAFLLIKIFAPGFYARQDTKTPVKIGLVAVGANLAFKALIVLPWIFLLGGHAAHVGLALTTALAAWVNVSLLAVFLHRRGAWRPDPALWRFITQVLVATLVMVAVLAWLQPAAPLWSSATAAHRALWLAGLILGGAVLFTATAALVGLHPKAIWRGLRSTDAHRSPS